MDQRFVVAKKILETLVNEGFQAMFAGGCVRDRIMGREPKDYDIATTALPEEVLNVAKTRGLKAVPTGLEHGTVTIIKNSIPIEVTTLRADIDTDGRHATVKFGASFEEDAARRDFTINAMYEDSDGKIHDFFGGKADIKAKALRFVGDPEKRIQEDYLRIMRLFRFWGELGFAPSEQTLHILAKQVEGLKKLSTERVWSELEKTLQSAPQNVLRAMGESNVLPLVFGRTDHFSAKTLQNLDIPEGVSDRAIFRLALISWREKLNAKAVQTQLRLSNKQALKLSWFLNAPSDIESASSSVADSLELARGWWENFPKETFTEPLAFAEACRPELKAQITQVGKNVAKYGSRIDAMPLGANDLMTQLSLKPGKALGELLAKLDRAFLNGDWFTSAEGLKLARELLNANVIESDKGSKV